MTESEKPSKRTKALVQRTRKQTEKHSKATSSIPSATSLLSRESISLAQMLVFIDVCYQPTSISTSTNPTQSWSRKITNMERSWWKETTRIAGKSMQGNRRRKEEKTWGQKEDDISVYHIPTQGPWRAETNLNVPFPLAKMQSDGRRYMPPCFRISRLVRPDFADSVRKDKVNLIPIVPVTITHKTMNPEPRLESSKRETPHEEEPISVWLRFSALTPDVSKICLLLLPT